MLVEGLHDANDVGVPEEDQLAVAVVVGECAERFRSQRHLRVQGEAPVEQTGAGGRRHAVAGRASVDAAHPVDRDLLDQQFLVEERVRDIGGEIRLGLGGNGGFVHAPRLANAILRGHGGTRVTRWLVPAMVVLSIVSAMRITLPSGTEAEIAEPTDSDDESTMGLVIAPDIFGLRPLFDDMVARLSSVWSMTVCAVEPFPGLDLGSDVEPRMAAMSGLDDDVHLRDLEEAADATGCERVGLLGFCMGGMYCFKSARSDRFAKIASFYGMIRLPEGWRGPGQGEPLEHLAAGHPERVLAIIGERDPYTPPDDVTALEATGVSVVRYADAEHGFAHAPERPAHRPADAADAFQRAQTWLMS